MNRNTRKHLNLLGFAIASALALSACGGGGGGGSVRPDPPPPPPPGGGGNPPPPPPPQVCEDNNAANKGEPLPCVFRYNGAEDNLLVGNNVDLAHAEGFTGKGVKVGVLDYFDPGNSGQDPALGINYIENYSPLKGKLESFQKEMDFDEEKDTHGIYVSSALLGSSVGGFKGGAAPDARLYAMHGGSIKPLYDEGVRIFSSSAGMWNFPPPPERANALYVGAAGNGGGDSLIPGGLATIPVSDHSFREMMITAIAFHASRTGKNDYIDDPWGRAYDVLLNEAGHDVYRAEYTSICGVAAMWCLGAVANTRVLDETQPDSMEWAGGTSMAAPIVSGVAALVWEAYPWMTASNIQKTVLTTATDVGEPGVDPIYGWGLVNARKAIDGPAQFFINEDSGILVYELYEWVEDLEERERTNLAYKATPLTASEVTEKYSHLRVVDLGLEARPDGSDFVRIVQSSPYFGERFFTADINVESRPFYNDISGNGGLHKLGSGTLTMTGNNTYTGGTEVLEGTLRSTGSFGSDVEVAPGATFMTGGSGVTINGDYNAYSAADWNDGMPVNEHRFGTATTAIQIGAPLTVTGEVDVGDNNTRLLLLPEAEGYTVQSTETLITAGRGLYGRFGEVTYGSGFFWNASLNYGANDLTATMTRANAQARAMSIGAPQKVVDGAKAADVLIGHLDNLVEHGQAGGTTELLSAAARLMAAPSDDVAALSLASLTGEIHGASRMLGVQRSLGEGERLADRLRSLTEPGMWVNSGNGNGTLSRVGYGDTEVHHSAFGFGSDMKLGNDWTVGLAATQTRSNARSPHWNRSTDGALWSPGHWQQGLPHWPREPRPPYRGHAAPGADRHRPEQRRRSTRGHRPAGPAGNGSAAQRWLDSIRRRWLHQPAARWLHRSRCTWLIRRGRHLLGPLHRCRQPL